MIKRLIIFSIFVFSVVVAFAQPFSKEIASFRKKDSVSAPANGVILFIGSSSFTKWQDVNDYFPGYNILNRGFGGSSLTDLIFYENDILYKYQPRQIVIYCGENDLAGGDTVSGIHVFERFLRLFSGIRAKFPEVQVTFVSMKPSPSRLHLMNKMEIGNHLIKDYLSMQKNTSYVDIYHRMLNEDGTPVKELFVQDNLHMNKAGYELWKKIIEPYLLK